MKLLFKQRFFSWLDSYDVYSEAGETLYTVKGQLAWGHCLKIFDAVGREVGMVKERIFSFFPKFEIYFGPGRQGCIYKEFSLFTPRFHIDLNGWQVQGDFFEWNYRIIGPTGAVVATVGKELLHWTDTYVIDVADPQDALCALALVIAIDAEKCSRSNH